MRGTVQLHNGLEFFFDGINKGLPFGLDQNFDAGLPLVIAPTVGVVHPDDGFDVIEHLVPRQKLAHHRANHRGAPHATAHFDGKAHLPLGIFHAQQANVVPARGGPVFHRTVVGNFEFARQVRKLGVQRAPLAGDLGKRAAIDHAVLGHPLPGIGVDVANVVAAGLDAVHRHAGQQLHHLGRLAQRNPVELAIGARREVAIAIAQRRGRQGCTRLGGLQRILRSLGLRQQRRIGLVVLPRNAGQHAQLGAADFAIRHRNAGHGRVALDVPAVLQAQRQQLLIGQLAALPALQLVPKLLGAKFYKLTVKFCVLVHGGAQAIERRPPL